MTNEWQPIETCPKDCNTYLAYDADDVGGLHFGVVTIRWCEEDVDGDFPAQWEVTSIDGGDILLDANITHWMPLPSPPQ